MRRECREHFPRHQLKRKLPVSHPGMHHGTCLTHVPWCMSGSLTHIGGENVTGIPGACATHHFTYLIRDPLPRSFIQPKTETWLWAISSPHQLPWKIILVASTLPKNITVLFVFGSLHNVTTGAGRNVLDCVRFYSEQISRFWLIIVVI